MNIVFSEQEQSIRKWWLRFFFAQFLLNIASYAYKFLFTEASKTYTSSFILGNLISYLIVLGLFTYGLYHYGYKKQGTKFLTIALISLWISILLVAVLTLGSLVSIALRKPILLSLFGNDHTFYEHLLSLISYVLIFPYYIYTVRLRRINKQKKIPVLSQSPPL